MSPITLSGANPFSFRTSSSGKNIPLSTLTMLNATGALAVSSGGKLSIEVRISRKPNIYLHISLGLMWPLMLSR